MVGAPFPAPAAPLFQALNVTLSPEPHVIAVRGTLCSLGPSKPREHPGPIRKPCSVLSGVRSGCAAALFTGGSGGRAQRSVLKSKQVIMAQSPQLVEISAATVNFWSCRGLVCWKTAGAWPAACRGFTTAAFRLRAEGMVLERWSHCGTC